MTLEPGSREVQPCFKSEPRAKKGRRPIRQVSEKRLAEAPERKAFREAVIAKCGGICVGPGHGLPGECRPVGPRRDLEVHEPDQRSTHPGSHLTSELAVSLCPWHHDYCTSPSGEELEIVMGAGLIVRATT